MGVVGGMGHVDASSRLFHCTRNETENMGARARGVFTPPTPLDDDRVKKGRSRLLDHCHHPSSQR